MDFGGCEAGPVDRALVRALREGPSVLPDDLHRLQAQFELVSGLLAEKAVEREPTWTLALSSGAEIETLLELERLVCERAAGVRARCLAGLLVKLSIWEALMPSDDCGDGRVRDRLVLSVRRDLEAMLRTTEPRPCGPVTGEADLVDPTPERVSEGRPGFVPRP